MRFTTKLLSGGDKKPVETAFGLEEGFYGPVYLRHVYTHQTAVYRLSEVSPRLAILSGYEDFTKRLEQLGAWPCSHHGVWEVRAFKDEAFERRLLALLQDCAERLSDLGWDASHPDRFNDALEDEEVRKRREKARGRPRQRLVETLPEHLVWRRTPVSKAMSWLAALFH